MWQSKNTIRLKISNMFAALENNLNEDDDDNMEINRAWKNTGKNIEPSSAESLGYYDSQV
jgi:hypothetical protein